MYFLTYEYQGQEKVGLLTKDKRKVIDVNIISSLNFSSMLELISKFDDDLAVDCKEGILKEAQGTILGIELEKVKICSPIPEPRRNIICLGLNYKEHIKESVDTLGVKASLPDHPIYFDKMADRIIGTHEELESRPDLTKQVDYEVELAVVIGKDGKDIPIDRAEEYIFGYSIFNDFSARDLQKQHIQWLRGKSLDTFSSMGPLLVHKSEFSYPPELNLSSKVNGELRQNSNTKHFIFDIPYILSDLSKGMTLRAGDIIATGTPQGVGMGFTPPKYLSPGDVVECTIEGLGTLVNKIK